MTNNKQLETNNNQTTNITSTDNTSDLLVKFTHETTPQTPIFTQNGTEKFNQTKRKALRQTKSIAKNPSRNVYTEVVHNFNSNQSRCATSSQILINGEEAECLIDTVAFTSFISEPYFNQRQLIKQAIEHKKRWISANGSQTPLTLTIGSTRITAPFIIARNLAQDIIIGVNILKPHSCIVDYKSNTLRCGFDQIPINSTAPVKTYLVHANCPVELRPLEHQVLWIPCDYANHDLYVHPLGRVKGIPTVVTTVTEGSHRHHIPNTLHNSSSRLLKIRKGDIIASISPASILLTIHNENEYNDFILKELSKTEHVNTIVTTRYWKPSERIKFPNNNLNKDQKLKLCNLIDEYHMIFA